MEPDTDYKAYSEQHTSITLYTTQMRDWALNPQDFKSPFIPTPTLCLPQSPDGLQNALMDSNRTMMQGKESSAEAVMGRDKDERG